MLIFLAPQHTIRLNRNGCRTSREKLNCVREGSDGSQVGLVVTPAKSLLVRLICSQGNLLGQFSYAETTQATQALLKEKTKEESV